MTHAYARTRTIQCYCRDTFFPSAAFAEAAFTRIQISRWISGCLRSGYLRSVYTCWIEMLSAFTRVQTRPDALYVYAAYSLCVGEIRKCFFLVKLYAFKLSSIFLFLFVNVCWLDDKCRVNIYTTSDFVKSSINFIIVFLACAYLYVSSL